jgi:hypothetical protein
MDLVIFYSPEKACITYYINNDSAGYKIEYPFSYIKNITLESGDLSNGGLGNGQKPGGLVVELNRPPNFFMDSSGSGGFYQCGDFTEDQQASQIMVHYLGGHPKVLSGQLAKLVSLESFQSRHNPFDNPTLSVSAPVSPNHRPASQPNHISHPHIGMFQESQFGISLHPGTARGHKRTRSRSVPIAVDFSLLQPMPSFHISQDPNPPMDNANIFAPVPQHHANLGPVGPNLRIDTSTGYGMDYRHYPLSAATTTSPSEYASPGFFASGAAANEAVPAVSFSTSYSLPFLSPMTDPTNLVQPSVSPLSVMSHADPVIANQSPPLSTMPRSESADIFALPHEHSNLSDDGMGLSELYSKQTLNLPMHAPSPGLSPGMDGPSAEIDMQQMITFDTIDPSSLSPANSGR